MRKRKKFPIYENIEITDVASEGKAIAKVKTEGSDEKELVIFVRGAVPGDVIDVQITRRKKSFKEGIPVKFHKYSTDRVEPFCEHFGVCGGCKWQQLPYEKQLFYKQKQVVDNLTRIGKVEFDDILPILPSE